MTINAPITRHGASRLKTLPALLCAIAILAAVGCVLMVSHITHSAAAAEIAQDRADLAAVQTGHAAVRVAAESGIWQFVNAPVAAGVLFAVALASVIAAGAVFIIRENRRIGS
ncbi:hypothetical protein GCM10025867_46410 (plasmid) [Frondihabitans sucicola]|uniref:PDGLE domain-containing protein n=1 Tax=Frondihabitans sucicola TaxID=1268041 RepID=A0ABM8GVA8_9MICO|nr:hypothetical protein [Frondihabitans sucicola]BDZ52400.1 hypothetical protein GCM10025867_46410 [Frondihabitans sucicola]